MIRPQRWKCQTTSKDIILRLVSVSVMVSQTSGQKFNEIFHSFTGSERGVASVLHVSHILLKIYTAIVDKKPDS